MLTLWAGQPESLWDESLPNEARELPGDLAALDRGAGLSGAMLAVRPSGGAGAVRRPAGRCSAVGGRRSRWRPYMRMMVLKRYRWGYRTLVAEVRDSIHLRRFCWICALGAGAG